MPGPTRSTRSILGAACALTLTAAVLTTVGTGAGEAAPVPPVHAAPSSATAAKVLPPDEDPFYRYTGSRPLARIRPGTVLKTRSVPLSLGGALGTPLMMDQLQFRTQDERGRPVVAITSVIAPTSPLVTGVVGYLSFYDALGPQCNPSYTLAGGDSGTSDNRQEEGAEELVIASLTAQGYAVTVPDFEGVKLDWVAGHESGWTTLDSLRATTSFLGLGRRTPVGLMGYSGGSIGAEWAAEQAPRYAPELNLIGVASGGMPVHLAHNLAYVNGSRAWSGVIPAVLVSLSRAYGLHRARYTSAYGRKVTAQVHDQCIGSFNGNYPGLRVEQLMKPRYRDFIHVPAFRRIINDLIMGSEPGHPTAPLFLGVGIHDGTGDDVMIARDAEALAHEYCRQGVPLRFETLTHSDHTQAGLQFLPLAEAFLLDRFAGLPFPDNCDQVGPGGSLAPVPPRR